MLRHHRPVPFDPRSLRGLKLWIGADFSPVIDAADAVPTIRDHGGYNWVWSQSGTQATFFARSTVNGRPGIQSLGARYGADTDPNATETDGTMLAVTKQRHTRYDSGEDSSPNNLEVLYDTSTDRLSAFQLRNTDDPSNWAPIDSGLVGGDSTTAVQMWETHWSAAGGEAIRDGVIEDSTVSALSYRWRGTIRLFVRHSNDTNRMYGTLGELLVWDRVLTGHERRRVRVYLQHKYGVKAAGA